MMIFTLLKRLGLPCLLVIILTFLSGCSKTQDAVENGILSFESLCTANRAEFSNAYLTIKAPGGRTYVAIATDFSQVDDVLVGIDLDDFMHAGFDPQVLNPQTFLPDFSVYDLHTSMLIISCQLGDVPFNFGAYKDAQGKAQTRAGPQSLLREMLRTKTTSLTLDSATGTYQITLGTHASIRWSPQLSGKIESIAFVLDASPFIQAGLDLERLEKWQLIPGSPSPRIQAVYPLP